MNKPNSFQDWLDNNRFGIVGIGIIILCLLLLNTPSVIGVAITFWQRLFD